MADHCFISRWKNKVPVFEFDHLIDHCLNFELDAQDKQGVASEYKETPSGYDDGRDDDECDGHTVTDENDKDECSMKRAHKERMNKICIKNDTRLTQDEIYHQKCIERVSPADPDIFKFCWRAVTRKKYPSNDHDWKDFICKYKFIYGKKKIMMDCLLYRLGRGNETLYKDMQNKLLSSRRSRLQTQSHHRRRRV